jgi:hypothetical protein
MIEVFVLEIVIRCHDLLEKSCEVSTSINDRSEGACGWFTSVTSEGTITSPPNKILRIGECAANGCLLGWCVVECGFLATPFLGTVWYRVGCNPYFIEVVIITTTHRRNYE